MAAASSPVKIAPPRPVAVTRIAPGKSPAAVPAAAVVSRLSTSPAQLPRSSGNSNTDALLTGGTNQWWFDRSANNGKSFAITYGFLGNSLGATAAAQDKAQYRPFTDAQKKAVREAFQYISSLVNISFKETSVAGGADINFGTNYQASSAGYANPPHASGTHNPFVMLANNQAANTSPTIGTYGWQTIVHEIGHALGLKHPGNYNAGGGGAAGPFLSAAADNQRNSVMSYNSPSDGRIFSYTIKKSGTGVSFSGTASSACVTTFMPYDITALQYLYGANSKAATFTPTTTFTNKWCSFATLWAPAADSAIDCSTVTGDNLIDMRDNAYSSINIKPQNPADLALYPSFLRAYSSNNSYYGLNNVGIAAGSAVTRAWGGGGRDVIFANLDSSISLDGGAGNDLAYLAGSAGEWSVTPRADKTGAMSGVMTNRITKQVVALRNIEAVRFYNAAAAPLTHARTELQL